MKCPQNMAVKNTNNNILIISDIVNLNKIGWAYN